MNQDKRVFFIGVTEFGLACFNKLAQMGVNIVGCVHTKDTLTARKVSGIINATYVDFEKVAQKHDIDCIYFDKVTSSPGELEQQIAELSPDLIIVAGWHYILRKELLDIPPLGVLGLHSSLLPKYRGGSPLVWQMINGEKEAGISLFYLEKGIDTGDIVGQETFTLEETDTIKEALLKSQEAGLKLIENYIPQVLNGTAPKKKQDESKATYVPQRIPSDGEINWGDSAVSIKNFIRAQTKPYPGAFTYIGGKKVIIWDADIIEE